MYPNSNPKQSRTLKINIPGKYSLAIMVTNKLENNRTPIIPTTTIMVYILNALFKILFATSYFFSPFNSETFGSSTNDNAAGIRVVAK